jgi:hypothetical protein
MEKPSYPGVGTHIPSQVAFQVESHWACAYLSCWQQFNTAKIDHLMSTTVPF